MKELFWIVSPGDIPLPCLDSAPDGTPREPDGVTYFDLESASRQSGMSLDGLRRSFANFMREQLAIAHTPANAPETAEPGELTFVPVDTENDGPNFDELLKGDLSGLDAETVRDRVRQRMAGLAPEFYAEFEEQMKQFGYDILRRECYPVVQWNADLKKNEVFCCATLDVVERKMLASGVCDGWAGPTLFAGPDGELKPIWLEEGNPSLCQVTLRRKGIAEPCVVVLDWNEAAQFLVDAGGKKRTRTLSQFWRERPKLALEKCAKMKAMRTLFRDFVGAVYAREELPELSRRTLGALPQPSTTGAGARMLPALGSTSSNGSGGSTAVLDLESIGSEVDARAYLSNRGLPDVVINRIISTTRNERGTLEDDDPERFWGSVVDVAVRRFGMRR